MSPWLLPVRVRDALIRQLVETSHVYDEATGELYDPPVLPPDRMATTGTATTAERTTSREEVARRELVLQSLLDSTRRAVALAS